MILVDAVAVDARRSRAAQGRRRCSPNFYDAERVLGRVLLDRAGNDRTKVDEALVHLQTAFSSIPTISPPAWPSRRSTRQRPSRRSREGARHDARARSRSARPQLHLRAGADEARPRRRIAASISSAPSKSIRPSAPPSSNSSTSIRAQASGRRRPTLLQPLINDDPLQPRFSAAAGVLLSSRRDAGKSARALQ